MTTLDNETKYLHLLSEVLDNGEWRTDETGHKSLFLNGTSMRFDLRKGFPAVTVKKLQFGSIAAELVGFLRGLTYAQFFELWGTKIWNKDANENAQWLANPFRRGHGHLGAIYGAQWRSWAGYKVIDMTRPGELEYVQKNGWEVLSAAEDDEIDDPEGHPCFIKSIDQLGDCVTQILENKTASRRILFHAWNPSEIDEMALPPCHVLYQFHPNPETRNLGMTMYMRSNDLGLGAPFNIASASLLLSLVARLTGYTPTIMTLMCGDSHIYDNQVDMVEELLRRDQFPAPTLQINSRIPNGGLSAEEAVEWLNKVEPKDFELVGYQHHEAISVPMITRT